MLRRRSTIKIRPSVGRHHQKYGRQRHTFPFGYQQTYIGRRTASIGFCPKYRFKILDIVEKEVISCSCFFVKLIPNIQTIKTHCLHFNPLPCRQTNVVARFGFHFTQNCIGILRQIQINGIGRQNVEIRFFEIPPVCIEIETKFLGQRVGLPFPYSIFIEMFFIFCPIRLPTKIVTNKYAVFRQKRTNTFRKLFQKHSLKFFRRLKFGAIRYVSNGMVTIDLSYYSQYIRRNNRFIFCRSMKKIRLTRFEINTQRTCSKLCFHIRPESRLLHNRSFV